MHIRLKLFPAGAPRIAAAFVFSAFLVFPVLLNVAIGGPGGISAEEINKHAKIVAEIHKLPLKKSIRHIVLSREKILDRIKELVFIDYTKEEVIDEGRMMVRVGLFPAGVDYAETVFQLLEEQVIGLYDTYHGELLLVDYLPDIMQDTTVDHEITHAIQDQNFNLNHLMKRRKGEGDRKYALSAVFEGDALLIEEALSGAGLPGSLSAEGIEKMMMSLSDKKSRIYKVPGAIRKSLLFPYSYGYVFMKNILDDGGYKAVNAVLADPPESTEQILHPDAYFNGDKPDKVSLSIPSEILSLYRIAGEDVMGEFYIKIWLEEFMDPVEASIAADGWEGDWFVFLWPKSKKVGKMHLGRGIFILVSKWEKGKEGSHPDAGDFFSALEQLTVARWKPSEASSKEKLKIYKTIYKEWIIIKQSGDTVIFVEGLPAVLFPDPETIADNIK